jgi:hypothetical protein
MALSSCRRLEGWKIINMKDAAAIPLKLYSPLELIKLAGNFRTNEIFVACVSFKRQTLTNAT